MTVEALAARIARLEAENEALVDLTRDLVTTVQQLARLAGAQPAEPDRPALRVLEGGMS